MSAIGPPVPSLTSFICATCPFPFPPLPLQLVEIGKATPWRQGKGGEVPGGFAKPTGKLQMIAERLWGPLCDLPIGVAGACAGEGEVGLSNGSHLHGGLHYFRAVRTL